LNSLNLSRKEVYLKQILLLLNEYDDSDLSIINLNIIPAAEANEDELKSKIQGKPEAINKLYVVCGNTYTYLKTIDPSAKCRCRNFVLKMGNTLDNRVIKYNFRVYEGYYFEVNKIEVNGLLSFENKSIESKMAYKGKYDLTADNNYNFGLGVTGLTHLLGFFADLLLNYKKDDLRIEYSASKVCYAIVSETAKHINHLISDRQNIISKISELGINTDNQIKDLTNIV